ncbi:MAG: DUF885 domain-containing protein [Candidatus Thermoplasmatota archaeon]
MTSEVDPLAEQVLAHRAMRHPAWATQVGIRTHDHELRDPSREAFEGEARELDAFLAAAEQLPESFDRDAIVTQLRLDLFELRDSRIWARNPDVASDYFDHLFALLLAAHISPRERSDALLARLRGCEAFFSAAWSRFDPSVVPPLWVEGAQQSARGAEAFLDAVRGAVLAVPGLARDVESPLAAARAVLVTHARWLEELHAKARGDVALGTEGFRRLLRLRHIGDSPEQLVVLGERLVGRFRREMEDAAGLVLAEAGKEPAHDVVGAALSLVRGDHPRTFAEVIQFYERSIVEAREFVRAKGLATVPDTPLDVVETPAFLRHLVPFAAYLGPARFATPRRGVYLVTPKMELSSFPNADTRNVTVHEAYPGHHLQLCVAAEKASLAAFLCEVPDLTEGWALYCEALMGQHGYTAAPAERLIRARDARWRAVRIVLDVALHTGGMTPQEAASRLVLETGMGVGEAEAEVLRYTLSPAYNLSYMWGRLQVERLRERALSSGLTERAFHDTFLSLGSVSVALLARELERRVDIRQD